MGSAPAFQFYADDYLVGTMTMTLAEKGAYMDCLSYQWSVGSVPGDDHKALARVMRCTPAESKRVWGIVSAKFSRGDDGQWRNARLEKERQKQAEYREAKARAGRTGGQAKPKQTPSTSLAETPPSVSVVIEANGVAKPSSPSPSPSSDFSPPPKNGGDARGAGLIRTSLEFEKELRWNAFVGARLKVPHKLHRDFTAALGGDNPEADLQAWYRAVDLEIETSREPIVPDVWKWLEARFKPWAQNRGADDMLAKWAAGESQHG